MSDAPINMKKLSRKGAPPTDGAPGMEPETTATTPPPKVTKANILTVAAEHPPAPPHTRTDGRTLRSTGRTVPLNTKITRKLDTQMRGLAEARGEMICVVLERAVEALDRLHTVSKERGMEPLELLDGLLSDRRRRPKS